MGRLLALLALVVFPAFAGFGAAHAGLDEAWRAFSRGDYQVAFAELLPLAEQNDANAQFSIAFLYMSGRGVSQDPSEAVKWYRRSAEQGNLSAQTNLGVLYETGQGVEKDFAEALKWYRSAADLGDSTAQYNLGLLHANGRGTLQDPISAVIWLSRASEQGHAPAQVTLALLYANGQGVSQDFLQAHVWFDIAATPEPPTDEYDTATMGRKEAAKRLTGDQIELAKAIARNWGPKQEIPSLRPQSPPIFPPPPRR